MLVVHEDLAKIRTRLLEQLTTTRDVNDCLSILTEAKAFQSQVESLKENGLLGMGVVTGLAILGGALYKNRKTQKEEIPGSPSSDGSQPVVKDGSNLGRIVPALPPKQPMASVLSSWPIQYALRYQMQQGNLPPFFRRLLLPPSQVPRSLQLGEVVEKDGDDSKSNKL